MINMLQIITMDCALVVAAPVHLPKMLSRQRWCAAYVQTTRGEHKLKQHFQKDGQESIAYLDIEIPVCQSPWEKQHKVLNIATINASCMLNDPLSDKQYFG